MKIMVVIDVQGWNVCLGVDERLYDVIFIGVIVEVVKCLVVDDMDVFVMFVKMWFEDEFSRVEIRIILDLVNFI